MVILFIISMDEVLMCILIMTGIWCTKEAWSRGSRNTCLTKPEAEIGEGCCVSSRTGKCSFECTYAVKAHRRITSREDKFWLIWRIKVNVLLVTVVWEIRIEGTNFCRICITVESVNLNSRRI